jgi:hypothetical protein
MEMMASTARRVSALVGVALVAGSPAFAAPCTNFDDTRNAAYMPYIQLVLGDLRAIDRGRGDAAFNAAVNALATRYSRGNTAEDVRKVIGIGLFNAMAVRGEPADTTFQLTCRSARNKLPPVNVLDPLACAVIAIDRSRKELPANRAIANEMLELAKQNLSADPDPGSARAAILAVSGGVIGCLGEP